MIDLPNEVWDEAAAEAELAYETGWHKLDGNWRPDWHGVASAVIEVLASHWKNQNPWAHQCRELKERVAYLQKIITDAGHLDAAEEIRGLEKDCDLLKKKCIALTARMAEDDEVIKVKEERIAELRKA